MNRRQFIVALGTATGTLCIPQTVLGMTVPRPMNGMTEAVVDGHDPLALANAIAFAFVGSWDKGSEARTSHYRSKALQSYLHWKNNSKAPHVGHG